MRMPAHAAGAKCRGRGWSQCRFAALALPQTYGSAWEAAWCFMFRHPLHAVTDPASEKTLFRGGLSRARRNRWWRRYWTSPRKRLSRFLMPDFPGLRKRLSSLLMRY